MRELQQGGFNASDISIIADYATGEYRAGEAPAAVSEACTGAATGSLLGGGTGLIVGLMGLAILGIGPMSDLAAWQLLLTAFVDRRAP